MEEIINKAKQRPVVTLDLEDHYPKAPRMTFDIADVLWQGLVLKEKDFRTFTKEHDWEQYKGAYVALYCSADAIVPTWAYMVIAGKLNGIAELLVFGSLDALEDQVFNRVVAQLDLEDYRGARVVVKGCSDQQIPESAYVNLTNVLAPVVKSISFGEPCSTVPVFKQPRRS